MKDELVHRVNWKLAKEAHDNSDRLLKGAKLAAAVDNHGLTVSLSVLSKEEAQKSLLLGFVCSGLYPIDDKDVLAELVECFKYHRYKILSSWLVEAFTAYFISQFEEVLKKQNKPEEMVASFRKDIVEKSVERLRVKRLVSGEKLDLLKERGFYVGPDHEGSWSLPSDFTKKKTEEILKEAEGHVLLVNAANYSLSRMTISDEWLSAATEFRRILKKKPTDLKALEALRKTGQLGEVLAGFWEFLVSNKLIEPKNTASG
jgi:AbiV family abortive infection protein